MADAILNESEATTPPLDSVLLWVTAAVEIDYAARAVFTALRRAHAKAHRGAATLHYLSRQEAEAVLEDAVARKQSVGGGTGNAYKAHTRGIQEALRDAAARVACLEAQGPACAHKSDDSEVWHGTKAQLKAHGIQLEGPWPREPGGNGRWAATRDSRGLPVRVARASSFLPPSWPTVYEARIDIPSAALSSPSGRSAGSRTDDAESLRLSLARMPKSPDDFRAFLIDHLRTSVRLVLDAAGRPTEWHGFTLDEGATSEVHASFDAMVEAIVAAPVRVDAARQAKIEQALRAKIAAADPLFRARYEALVRPNPRILEGGSR